MIWSAETSDGNGRYLALFNISDRPLLVEQELKAIDAPRRARAYNLWTGQTSDVDTRISLELRQHQSAFFRLS